MSSDYCERSDVEDHYGVSNVAAWAKLQSSDDASTVTARIARAIAAVSSRMDAYLRAGGYAIPVVDEDGETPTEVEDTCAALVGCWLYNQRGVDDVDRSGSPRNKLQWHYEESMQFLRDVRDSKIRINAREHTG